MSDTTTRRDVMLAGLAVAAPGVSSAQTRAARFRVAVAGDYENLALKYGAWESLGDDAEVVSFVEPFRSRREAISSLRDFDALLLMRERAPIAREVLENLPRLKVIIFSGLTNQSLDHHAAAERNIVVIRSMGFQQQTRPVDEAPAGGGSPSEHALALVLACSRQVRAGDALIREGRWAGLEPGISLRGKTLGIVGYGDIGKPVGRYGLALGMRVLGFSRSLTDEVARAEGVTRADLETLLRTADVVSIHLPLTTATTGMIGATQIGWMKPGVILVNTARGSIVDEAAVIEALRTRKIASAGFDVFWEEPLPAGHPLRKLPNVVMTPHIGYVTEPAMAARYKAMSESLAAYRRGSITERYTPPDEYR